MSSAARDDCVAIEHQTVDRLANLVVTVVPFALLGLAIFLAWGSELHWPDLVVLAISYILTGVGITVGYHRLFTHRSFETYRGVRYAFAVLGLRWIASIQIRSRAEYFNREYVNWWLFYLLLITFVFHPSILFSARFRHPNTGDIFAAELFHHLERHLELAFAAVDHNELRVFILCMAQPPAQDLFHAGKIV